MENPEIEKSIAHIFVEVIGYNPNVLMMKSGNE
jgi:hypothetical protein